ncbi:hypothetical protein ACP70R_015243 [Stipagrostis hirtigluma subsp. patula]
MYQDNRCGPNATFAQVLAAAGYAPQCWEDYIIGDPRVAGVCWCCGLVIQGLLGVRS